MKKINIFIFIIALVVVIIVGLRFFTPEDGWICENGTWQRHGNPSSPMPTKDCSSNKSNNITPSNTVTP
jgi:hypothetical protein